jgi:hypothetical protein
MKRIQMMAITMALVLGSFTSCTKNSTDNTVTSTATSTILLQGTWKITYFSDSGTDETAMFNGYIFTFVTGGSVSAINGSLVSNGSWTTYNDDSQNKLSLDFGVTTAPLANLKHDWNIIEKTSIKISFQDISGGTGKTAYLTFEKI